MEEFTKRKSTSVNPKPNHPTLLFTFPEFWVKLRAHFGDAGLFWFRDSPQITHWKSVYNPLVWDFMLFEWIFATRIKGTAAAAVNCDYETTRFNPAQDEDWNFVGKPYVPQGCRRFRSDIRNWIKKGHRNSSGRTGMLKNLIIDPTHQDCVPESVILVMKQILAIEQTFNVELFTKLGLMTAPPPGTDMNIEADIRLNKLINLYSPHQEQLLTSSTYFITHESTQAARREIHMESSWKSSNPLNTEYFLRLKAEPPASKKDVNEDEGDTAPPKKRAKKEVSYKGLQYESSISSASSSSTPQSTNQTKSQFGTLLNSITKLEKTTKILSKIKKKRVQQPAVGFHINVYSKSGKLIAENFPIESSYTFTTLLSLLPLPSIDEDEGYIVYKDDKRFDGDDVVVEKVGDGESVFIRREKV